MNDAASSLFLSSLEGFGVALLESLLDESATVEETNIGKAGHVTSVLMI